MTRFVFSTFHFISSSKKIRVFHRHSIEPGHDAILSPVFYKNGDVKRMGDRNVSWLFSNALTRVQDGVRPSLLTSLLQWGFLGSGQRATGTSKCPVSVIPPAVVYRVICRKAALVQARGTADARHSWLQGPSHTHASARANARVFSPCPVSKPRCLPHGCTALLKHFSLWSQVCAPG